MLGSFEFLGKEYGYYMIMALIGALTSGAFSYIMAKKQKLNEVKIVILLLFSVIGVLIGGHLLYGITNADKLWLSGVLWRTSRRNTCRIYLCKSY